MFTYCNVRWIRWKCELFVITFQYFVGICRTSRMVLHNRVGSRRSIKYDIWRGFVEVRFVDIEIWEENWWKWKKRRRINAEKESTSLFISSTSVWWHGGCPLSRKSIFRRKLSFGMEIEYTNNTLFGSSIHENSGLIRAGAPKQSGAGARQYSRSESSGTIFLAFTSYYRKIIRQSLFAYFWRAPRRQTLRRARVLF